MNKAEKVKHKQKGKGVTKKDLPQLLAKASQPVLISLANANAMMYILLLSNFHS